MAPLKSSESCGIKVNGHVRIDELEDDLDVAADQHAHDAVELGEVGEVGGGEKVGLGQGKEPARGARSFRLDADPGHELAGAVEKKANAQVLPAHGRL